MNISSVASGPKKLETCPVRLFVSEACFGCLRLEGDAREKNGSSSKKIGSRLNSLESASSAERTHERHEEFVEVVHVVGHLVVGVVVDVVKVLWV